MQLTAQRCLVLPDVHQDIAWVERVLKQEAAEPWDRLVFLGDYFDTRGPQRTRASVEKTCDYLEKLRREAGDRVVFLLGNHDIQYLEAKPAWDRHRAPKQLFYHCGSAYSPATAAKVAEGLSAEFWAAARLFVVVNGWLLSHAGLAAALWPGAPSWEESLALLERDAHEALTTMRRGRHPLLEAGEVRGGDAPVGGITWLDWREEFVDALPCPQLVGHTASPTGARQKGRSWCLDGAQSSYGVLTAAGLTTKRA